MKKKLNIIAIVMLLLLTLSFALVACKPKEPIIEGEPISQRQVIDMFMAGHGYGESAVLSTDFAIDADVTGQKYNVAIRTNLNAKNSQILLEIKNAAGVIVTGLYIIDGKIYIDLGANNAKLYLADFDVSDIAQMLLKMDIIDTIDGALSGTDFTFDAVLDLVAGLLFSEAKVTKEGNLDVYTMNIMLKEMYSMLSGILIEVDIDKMIMDLGINIDINLNELIRNIVIPKDLTAKLIAKMDGTKTVSTEIIGNMAEASLFNMTLTGGVFSTVQDLKFPEGIAEFTPFSLTNISFDATLNIASDKLDLADIVNLLTGGKTLPKDVLIFNSDKDFSVKFRMDLDIENNMKNLVFIEIFAGKNFDSKIVGVYFYQGVLYIDYSSVLQSGTKLPNMKIENIDISKELRGLVNMITGTISADSASQNGVQSITTKTSDATLSPDMIAFAKSVINMVGMNNNVSVDGDKVSIKINQQLIDMLSAIMTGVDITYPEFLGDIDIDINLSPEKGIDNVDITANLPDFNSVLKVNLNNFMVGYFNSSIEGLITDSIKDKEFITDYSQIIAKAFSGTSISGQFKINMPKGDYDLSVLFKALGVNIPSINYTLTDGIVDELFTVEMKMQLDTANKDNNNISIEIKAVRDNVFCNKGLFIGIYHKNNAMYLDASRITIAGFKLPVMKIDIDLASMLTDEIAKLGYGNLYAEAGNSFTIPTENRSEISNVNDIIEANIDNNKLVILATSKAIANILAAQGIDITLPEFTITGEIISMNDIKINIASGELSVDYDVTDIVVGVKQTFDFQIVEDSYYEDLVTVLMDKLSKLSLDTTIDISSRDGKLDVTNFINGILATTGSTLAVPIEFEMVNYNSSLKFIVKWNIDKKTPNNTEMLIELRTDNDANQLLFGFYLYGGTTYIDIPAISAKLRIDNLNLSKKIADIFTNIEADISLNIGKIIQDLLAGKAIDTKPKANSITNMADGGITLPSEFVQYLFEGLSLKNTAIGLNYTAELLGKMLLSIGIDTSVNTSLTGSLDVVAGTLNLNGTLGVLSLGITSKVAILGEAVDTGLSEVMFFDFKVLDATNGVTLTDTLFNAMSPSFNIDMFTRTKNATNQITRLAISKSGKEQVLQGVALKPDDIIIAVYDEYKIKLGDEELFIFITDDMIKIRGTRGWFVLKALSLFEVASGESISFDIPMNLKSMLYDTMNELLKVINPLPPQENNSLTDVADASAPTFDVASLLSKVQIALMPTDQTRISIKINAENFNKLITDTINGIFQSIAVDNIPGADPSKVIYDQTSAGNFSNLLWDYLLKPFAKSTVASDLQQYFGVVEGKLKEHLMWLINRFLPLPNSNEINININLDQNKLSSVEINLRDTANNHFTEFDIINTAAEGAIDWSSRDSANANTGTHPILFNKIQSTYVEYDPYSSISLESYFNTKARKIVNGKFEYADIVWTMDGATFNPAADKGKLVYKEEPYTITGTAFGQTITVLVKVLTSSSVTGIKPISISPYGKLPSKVEIILEDGSTREVDYSAISGVEPNSYKAHSVTGKVTLAGVEHDITVNYLDGTIKNLMGGTNFYIDAYQYGRGEYKLADKVSVQFMYGGHSLISATYDYSALTGTPVTADGAVRTITMTIGNGNTLQTIELLYTITAKTVSHIEYNSKTFDKYNVDPYAIALNGINAYDTKAQVYYTDGTHESLDLVWNIEGVNNTYLGAKSQAKVSYTVGEVSWEREVIVDMARREALHLDFDGKTSIEVNPLLWNELGQGHYFPANATVVFETGENAILPIAWDLTHFDITNQAGSFNNVTATIAPGTPFEQKVQVGAKVNPVRPEEIVLTDNVYTINPVDVLYNNQIAYSEKLTVKFADGRQENVKVVWNHENVSITLAGGGYKAIVGVGDVSFEIDVVVTACSDLTLKDNALTIDPIAYEMSGGIGIYADKLTYTASGVEYSLPVSWTKDTVIINQEGGTYGASVTIGSGANAKVENVVVTVLCRKIASIGITDNSVTIAVGGSLPVALTVTFTDGTTMELEPIYGSFDNATAGTYNAVTVKFFSGITSLEQNFTITVIVE